MTPRRRTGRVAATLLAALALLAACGDDDDGATATTTADAPATTMASSSAAPEPVTIEHAYGTTTIEGRPERIVSLNLQWTDVLLALGVQPVGHAVEPLAGAAGIYPWEADLSSESTGLDVTAGALPLEQIAALEPDLILVTHLVDGEAIYNSLSEIAPTIGPMAELQVDPWPDLIEVAGRFLGVPDKAAAVVDEVEGLLAVTAAEYPGLAGQTFALANFIPGDSIYVVADPADGSSVFFQELGMQLDPEILAVADGVSGRANISLEQAGLLDADLLVVFSNGADPSELVGYDQLAVVRAGAVAEVDFAAVVGLNTPSPLSIPYSLEVVRPALAAAAAEPA